MSLTTMQRNSDAGWMFIHGLSAMQNEMLTSREKSWTIVSDTERYSAMSSRVLTFKQLPKLKDFAS